MDLKIKDVADLLNISETTVRRWLMDGKIPAYRLNRQYRFSRTEIEDWVMRQKLGFAIVEEKQEENGPDEDKPAQKTGNMQFSFYRALYRGGVYENIPGSTKEEIIRNTTKVMGERYELDPDVLADLLLDREQMMPTSLGNGIGVPHTRDFLLNTHFDVIAVVYPEKPVEYGALDDQPVHTLFFLFACEDKRHLHLLAKLAHLSNNKEARDYLMTRPSLTKLLEYIKAWEGTLHIK